MACRGMIMVTRHDRAAEASISRDIDASLVSQDTGIIVPIGKARAEIGRDRTRESMEGIEDQWVRSGG